MKDYSFKGPRIYCPISPREKGSFWYDRSAFLLLILICGPLTEKGTNHSLYSYICLVALFHSILVPLWQLWNDHKKDFFKRVKSLRKIISLKRKEREGKLLVTFTVEIDQHASIIGRYVAFVNCAASVDASLRSFGLRCTHDGPAKGNDRRWIIFLHPNKRWKR